jgi:hypothetical protein
MGRDVRAAVETLVEHEDRLRLDALGRRPEASALLQLLTTAAYWQGFGVARFEPLLVHAPPPLSALGIGVLLKFGEHPAGRLEPRELAAARTALAHLPSDLREPALAALDVLAQAVEARERLPEWERQGFRPTALPLGSPAHALRSSGGAQINIDGEALGPNARVPLGVPLTFTATDERGRPLPPPELQSATRAPVWTADGPPRRAVFLIPGPYEAQVPGRAFGRRTVLAGSRPAAAP